MVVNVESLERFVLAQDAVYESVVTELKTGRKTTHWMWFVFPQLEGLGQSAMARQYAIHSRAEAVGFLNHPILGVRLLECTNLMLAAKSKSTFQILGTPDDLKFKSCMTLFAAIAGDHPIFDRALTRFYGGKPDMRTLELLGALSER